MVGWKGASQLTARSLGASQTFSLGTAGRSCFPFLVRPPLSHTTYMLFQKAFSFHGVEGLYLLTDGKPDTSCSLVLSEVQRLKGARDLKVHTISLGCTGRWARGRLGNLPV